MGYVSFLSTGQFYAGDLTAEIPRLMIELAIPPSSSGGRLESSMMAFAVGSFVKYSSEKDAS
jgi:hypothetical protein